MYLLSDHVSLFVAVLTHTEHTFYSTNLMILLMASLIRT